MYWYYEDVYVDLWVPDFGSNRWRRELDVTTGAYQYQHTDTSANAVSAWGTAVALGAPGQITAANAATRLVISNQDDALAAHRWLRELTGALAARLLQIRNSVAVLQADAGGQYDNVNDLLAQDAQADLRAQAANNDADRTRLVRLGMKFLVDAHVSVASWALSRGPALGVQQQPLVAVAQRGSDLGGKLLTAMQ